MMEDLNNKPIIFPSGRTYELYQDFEYKDIVVPKGFKSDGMSYKLRIFGLVMNRFEPKYSSAFIVHDYLTERGDWDKAQKYFNELLPDDNKKKLIMFLTESYRKLKGL